MRIDEDSGVITTFVYRGTELIGTGPRPHFWRAATDNDRGNRLPERSAVWRAASSNWVVAEIVAVETSPTSVEVRVTGTLPDVSSSQDVVYTILGNGEIWVESLLIPGAIGDAGDGGLPELPRFGMQMTVPDTLDTMTWYGRGPHESYWNRKVGAPMGVYTGSVRGQYVDYSEPQENGNKTDVRWVRLTRADGVGIEAVGLEPGPYRYGFKLRPVWSEQE